ncbi:MAG: hypothetical protein IT304_01700 [Dehalococcoidia bacterium]|nr:hypothetical protein [Dehalococcoidia bacterium]
MVTVPVPAGAITALVGELTAHLGTDEAVIEGPAGSGDLAEVAPSPPVLRSLARFDVAGRYRPLSGARSLRPGWFARCPDLEALAAALDAVYPLAQAHSAAWVDGTLRVVSFDEVLSRQSGRYAAAARLSPAGRQLASHLLCRLCVRSPVWRGALPADGDIPCPEACSVLVSLCREAALWEQKRPPSAPIDPQVPFAAFDRPGNELREQYLAARYAGSDG